MNEKQLNILDNLAEKQAERICRNIGVALQNLAFAFYESDKWLEISIASKNLKFFTSRNNGNIGGYVLGLKQNYAFNNTKFKNLLKETMEKLLNLGVIKDFSIEKMLINLDLEGMQE